VSAGLAELLRPRSDAIHSIAHRVKSRESLRRKLLRPDKIYRALSDVTDVLGIRIVTYFEDATFQVASSIEQALRVHLDHSDDKRRLLHSTEFGYRSLHYVCSLPQHGMEGFRFEIQIRTILQHAWAEIEHDLGYKSPASVPEAIRRRFSRLASLLELADEEFVGIRRHLSEYERSLRADRPEALRGLSIDRVSLEAFARTEFGRNVDAAVARQLALPMDDALFFPDYLIRMLSHVGITRVDALERALADRQDALLRFVPGMNRSGSGSGVAGGWRCWRGSACMRTRGCMGTTGRDWSGCAGMGVEARGRWSGCRDGRTGATSTEREGGRRWC
jgi:putative GTP pyrophosphokinase